MPLVIRDRNSVLLWLSICLLFVALMVLVGGYTRLSGSGLSITEWKPVHGVIPPIGEQQWQEEFVAYQATPQYKLVNSDMSLAGFKEIFWPEYFHRLLARTIGLIFFLPLIVFALRKSTSKRFFWRMLGIFALGGLQGAMGWIMVKSGLQDAPYVSHIKLTLHLSLAFLIFALILWAILDVLNKNYTKRTTNYDLRITLYKLWLSLFAVQIIFGGLMAGSHAGLIYNTWPDMNGEYLPDGIFSGNLLENITFIQFIHRTFAILVTIMFLWWCYRYKNYLGSQKITKYCITIVIIILAQFALGVFTLLNHVPLPLALAHQMTALLLWFVAVALLHKLIYKNG
ncbi:MAG: COX15/CtaA family protein [Rickettsiales bacterium]